MPFEHVKAQIEYHAGKLREVRGLFNVRLQMIAHHYIYFQDGLAKGWQSLGIQRLALQQLRTLSVPPNTEAGDGAPAAGGAGGRVCSHCKSGFHPGNKSKCFWKELPPREAREAARETARNLGVRDMEE